MQIHLTVNFLDLQTPSRKRGDYKETVVYFIIFMKMEKAKISFSWVNTQKRAGNKIENIKGVKEEVIEVDRKRLKEAVMVILCIAELYFLIFKI